MNALDTGSALLEVILANPSDPVPKLVLADWLDEQDEWRLANAYRWCAKNGKHTTDSVMVPGDVLWWNEETISEVYPDVSCAHLPVRLWRLLKNNLFGEARYGSFAEAMQAVADHLEPIE